MSKNLLKVNKCNLCGSESDSWKPLFPLTRDQNLMQCRECKLVFNDYQRIDFDIIYPDTYYDKSSKVRSGGGFYNYTALEKAKQRFSKFAYDFILKNAKPKMPKRILDIGCSYGFFLKLFAKDKRFIASGIELNKKAAEIARKSSIRIYSIPFEKFNKQEEYDYITFFELIEHVLDPAAAMEKINTLLKPGGYALLTTPNIDSFFFKLLKRRWPCIHPAVHNYYFNPSTIRKLGEKTGFKVISIKPTQIFWVDVFHTRKRLSELFPLLKVFFNLFSFLDPMIIPFFQGGLMEVVLKKSMLDQLESQNIDI